MNATVQERSPRVAVFGEWSGTNLGDRAIHEGVQRYFHEHGWEVDSYEFGALRPTPPPQPLVATTQTATPQRRALHSRLPRSVARTMRSLRQQVRARHLAPRLESADAICIGGGALLTDINLQFPQSLAVLGRTARKLDKPLLCLGCSAEGPWSPAAERLIREFVRERPYLAVRDQRTAERLERLGAGSVPVFGDFALPLDARRPRRDRSSYRLAINVAQGLGVSETEQARYERALAHAVRHIALRLRTEGRMLIYTTGNRHDLPAAERLKSRLDDFHCEVHAGRDVAQLRALMAESAAVIATRLHAAILALGAQTPVVGLSPTDKIANFFATLDIESCAFGPEDPAPAVLEKVRDLLAGQEQLGHESVAPLSGVRAQVGVMLETLARDLHGAHEAAA
ncbi:MAG TPA: polysaccharide pyruvyl transferase family protein [Steroidobacteraceae bacterium]|nr:polysaccharide pyruvyl transferase family protein [Steroidobacteraceae bacterium]